MKLSAEEKMMYIEEFIKYLPSNFNLEDNLINYYENLNIEPIKIINLKNMIIG